MHAENELQIIKFTDVHAFFSGHSSVETVRGVDICFWGERERERKREGGDCSMSKIGMLDGHDTSIIAKDA